MARPIRVISGRYAYYDNMMPSKNRILEASAEDCPGACKNRNFLHVTERVMHGQPCGTKLPVRKADGGAVEVTGYTCPSFLAYLLFEVGFFVSTQLVGESSTNLYLK